MRTAQAVAFVLKDQGLTKYGLAKALGLGATTSVYQWLKGTRMNSTSATKFEELYGITISDVYDPLCAPAKSESGGTGDT